jgi:hypothetical protein
LTVAIPPAPPDPAPPIVVANAKEKAMRKHERIAGLVIVGVLLSGGSADAQFRGGGPGGGGRGFGMGMMGGSGMGGPLLLAGIPAVQKEISLEGEGAAKIQKLLDSFREEMAAESEKAGLGFGGFGQFGDVTPEEREAKMREMSEKRTALMTKLNEKFVPHLKEVVSKTQFERLQQIGWQAAGSLALSSPELGTALDLTKEQQKKIADINKDYGDKQAELRRNAFGGAGSGGGGAGGFQEMIAKTQELNKERDGKAIEALSKEQQEKLTKLKGKPFDLAQLMPMGPGGPGGRGGPAGRPQGAGGRPQNKAEPEKKSE